MRKRLLCVLVVAVLLLGVLAGCGDGPSSNPDTNSSGVGSAEPAKPDNSDDTPETGSQSLPEPTPVIPYAEENGLSFSKEKVYTIPAFTFFQDALSGEPTSIDGLSITDVVDSSYTFGDVSVSEADADGMVQMTIPYRLDLTTTVTLDISKFDGQWYLGWGCEAIEVFDYYTGTVVPGEDMSTDDDKPTDISGNAIDITYKDVTYSVSCMESVMQNVDFSDWSHVGGDTYEQQAVVSMDITCAIYMPKEYDGLCLSLYLPGKTEYSRDDEDSSEVTTLLEDVEDINDYVLIRVSDLM